MWQTKALCPFAERITVAGTVPDFHRIPLQNQKALTRNSLQRYDFLTVLLFFLIFYDSHYEKDEYSFVD